MVFLLILRYRSKRIIGMKDFMTYCFGRVKMKNHVRDDPPFSQMNPKFSANDTNLTFNNSKGSISALHSVLDKYSIKRHEPEIQAIKNLKAITLDYRCRILLESGFKNVSTKNVSKYITLSRTTISCLKKTGYLEEGIDVQNHLVKCLSAWPTSPPMSEAMSDSAMTLNEARMRVLSRYLELKIDLPPETFRKCIITYPRIKHRPLSQINDVLHIIQTFIEIPNNKISTHFAILHADFDNVKKILELRSLGGIDIREILKKKPILLNINYKSIQNIRQLMIDERVSLEAQRRCFEIYTLGYETVKRRLQELKKTPEFKCLIDNPRILRLVFYKKKADQRLQYLKNIDKKCISLNVLSGPSEHFSVFANSQGDFTKGNDVLNNICSILQNNYSYSEIHEVMRRHPMSNKVPLLNLFTVHSKLKTLFSSEDIFCNCYLLLYQWESISRHLGFLLRLHAEQNTAVEIIAGHTVDMSCITKVQILSLTLYLIEKEHHFDGCGVWNKKRSPCNDDLHVL